MVSPLSSLLLFVVVIAAALVDGQPSSPDSPLLRRTANRQQRSLTTASGSSSGSRSTSQLQEQLKASKTAFLEKLRTAYGPDLFPDLFLDHDPTEETTRRTTKEKERGGTTHNQRLTEESMTSTRATIGRKAFGQGSADTVDVAWSRWRRKFIMAILEYQRTGIPTMFVWATAGDQVAAGRGNFFSQQYTAVLQTAVVDMMESVGIDFQTRPYGMGSLRSAPEIAACAKAIYGEDVDVVSWDFTASDKHQVWRLEYFAHRVARMKQRPALLVLQSDPTRHQPIVEHLTQLGMAILGMDTPYVQDRLMRMPDYSSSSTTTDSNQNDRTDLVQYFRCGNHLESGDAACTEHRFYHTGDNTECDNRPYQTQWHPGYKWHAFQGNVYALFLMEVLEDALMTLSQLQKDGNSTDPQKLWEEYQTAQESDYQHFETQDEFLYGDAWTRPFTETAHPGKQITAHMLADQQAFCHTARLPAQARYRGYVTDVPFEDGMDDFDTGAKLPDAVRIQSPHMILTYDESAHNQTMCHGEKLRYDAKDFFTASGAVEGFQDMIVPNDSELDAFGTFGEDEQLVTDPIGIILVCASSCHHHACPPETLNVEAINRGQISVKVNDEPVDHVVPYEGCHLLAKKSGELLWTADERKQYNIAVNVHPKDHYVRIGSVIVW